MLERIKKMNRGALIGGSAFIVATIATLIIVMVVFFGGKREAATSERPADTTTDTSLEDNTGDITEATNNVSSEHTTENKTENNEETSTTIVYEEDKEDPELNITDDKIEDGNFVDINDIEDIDTAIGIDVSRYQGTIDWKKVAAAGIDFAMIRVGYRTTKTGEIVEDPYAKYNIVNARKNGIDVGVYFFSSAISEEEAKAESDWVAEFIKGYNIAYPVAYNCENYNDADSRQSKLNKSERSELAVTFLNEIKAKGHTPMFYASKYEMENDNQWDISTISKYGKIWVAHYQDKSYVDGDKPSYSGIYHMWQYTANGIIDGIDVPVDINVSYLEIESNGNAPDENITEDVTISPEANMNFQNVNENVTAKIKVNLRNKPSQGSDSTVIATINNGDIVKRTGISPSGWSRLEYQGQVCYAVTSYLTTDTTPTIEKNSTENQEETTTLKNQFTEVNIQVTPKEEVNLRTLPSVTDSEVVATIKNGDVVTKTGVSNLGWARVIYDGQVLYCIDSYLQEVEENT